MKRDTSIGIIIFRKTKKTITYLIIKHNKGHWGFPKGHRDTGERAIDAALRELYEETGINKIDLISRKIMLKEHYIIKNKNKEHTLKTVQYFIAKTSQRSIKIDGNEIVDYQWCPFNKAIGLITFSEAKEILIKAHKIIEAL
ncbi:MAG: bis(5'-nucleosyl)-tetraphosphatase [Ignavibacteria bacterium]